MGKCASKQPAPGLNEFGSAPYLPICSEDDILYINVVTMDECQHELDFEELEKLCRHTPEDELSEAEADQLGETGGTEEGGGAGERFRDMGQSESKKASKKAATDTGLHTKGTAMSFGFKKHKVHQATTGSNGTIGTTGNNKLPPGAVTHTGDGGGGVGAGAEPVPGAVANQIKKFSHSNHNNNNNNNNNNSNNATLEREKAERELVQATVISNPGVDAAFSDNNGNSGSVESVDDTSGGVMGPGRTAASTGRSTPRLQPAKKDSNGAPYRSNRFGFRTNNIVRPASVGLQPRVANDFDKHSSTTTHTNNNNNNIHAHNNNNNNVYVVNDKRRSKSASSAASARTTFTPLPGTTAAAAAATGTGGNGAIVLHQHAYGGGATALHRPLPKYQAPSTKITHATVPDSNSGAGGTYQQQMTKCNQGEHKNTQHSGAGAKQTAQQHQYTHGSEAGQNAPSGGGLCAKPPLTGNGHTVGGTTTSAKLGQETAATASKFTLHTSSLPKPQYPVSISLTGTTAGSAAAAATATASSRYTMDTKGAKHAVNVSRKEFANTNVTGAPALEDTTTTTTSSIRMPRQRYRNLEMVMSGRHKFEVRDLEALTTEPIVPLPLPELPSAFCSTGNQRTAPLSGLIRSTELNAKEQVTPTAPDGEGQKESLEEEKLLRDNNSSEKSLIKGGAMKELMESYEESKSSTPSCSRASWFTAGEALAAKDFGIRSLTSSRRTSAPSPLRRAILRRSVSFATHERSSAALTFCCVFFAASISAPIPMDVSATNLDSVGGGDAATEPNRMYRNEQAKFAEMAAAISDVLLLDDETSPTDSLVSSCTENSDDVKKPRGGKKTAENTKEKEKDIDEISPELDELTSPVSPGTPTHASNSLSLSDGGRDFLIDDEIADQPGLVFDEGSTLDLGSLNLNLTSQKTDTDRTLKDNHNPPKPRRAMPDAYESPALSRKSARSGNRMARAESLDTLSPCDSIASDDFMLDFDCNSSMDSIDRVARSSMGGSANGINSMDELQLWSELENKGGHIIREWSTLLRSSPQSNSTHSERTSREEPATTTTTITILRLGRRELQIGYYRFSASHGCHGGGCQAVARLLTRRLQNNATPTNGSESPRSIDSLPRRTFAGSYKTATLSQFHNLANNNNNCTDSASTATNSAEDLTLLDKSLRNSMLQDVVHFKKQLVRLRRIMQETDTLNPFENNNGQFFTTAAAAMAANENILIRESSVAALALLEDQRQELADLRRQVVYLQGELTAKDRTIRQQQNLIEKYEAEREKQQQQQQQLHSLTNGGSSTESGDGTALSGPYSAGSSDRNHQSAETISTATQTEQLRPVSFGGQEGLGSRSEKPVTPKNGLRTPSAVGLAGATPPHQHHHHHTNGTPTTPKSKTQISSVYTQLSSVRHSYAGNGSAPTTPTHNAGAQNGLRRTSLGSSHNLSTFGLHSPSERSPHGSNKPVRTTQIGTLASPIQRQPPNGGTTVKPPPSKAVPPSRTNGVVTASKLNGLNGTAKRPAAGTTTGSSSIIRPPSSFGSSSSLASVGEPLKSKSAPLVVVPNGKLLTPAATGAATSDGREPSGSESDKDTVVVNGGAIGTAGSCCSEENNLASAGNTNGSTVNGIVGH
ncbi:AGAP005803-PA [Anopheles gambiae str. PEST]|uniref:AGAP005803-PA n=1 Tax=Anopheles gambiae TaxID=7165 RepID=Q7Q6J9_ANOGA|nr:AGAP005803-PA [Anopheles gambiae str. PEST]